MNFSSVRGTIVLLCHIATVRSAYIHEYTVKRLYGNLICLVAADDGRASATTACLQRYLLIGVGVKHVLC